MAGTGLVVGSGCVLNNYLDRDIDKKMKRTRSRALAAGSISLEFALIYAGLLGGLGFAVLVLLTNWLTVGIGLVGLLSYVYVYGYFKRRSRYGTLVGTLPGSTPILAGYAAITGQLDGRAMILLLIMATWQMPHFYAIAIRRLDEYKKAGLPVWPVVKGIKSTQHQMVLWVGLFCLVNILLVGFSYAKWPYLLIMLAAGVWWGSLALKFSTYEPKKYAGKMFGRSLITLIFLSASLTFLAN